MPNINKLLNKVNQASQALKSAKGIKAKIQQAGYKGGVNTEEVDKLQEQAEENRRKLEERRASLQKELSSANKTQSKAKRAPADAAIDLQYPLAGDFDNFIVFTTRPRKKRAGGNYLTDNAFSIALYLPEDIPHTTAVGYKEDGVGGAARSGLEVVNQGFTMDGMIEEGKNMLKTMTTGAMAGATGGITNLKAGMASNPMLEQMMAEDPLNFRTHQFEWEMMPKSYDEADMVTKIINIFRLAMLPDTFGLEEGSPIENFFNYPNIFDVEIEGPIAKNVERFLPMVCSSVTVDTFGGNSEALLGQGDEMFAASTKLSLEFKEIKILSQEVYMDKVAAERWSDVGDVNSAGSPSIVDEKSSSGFDDPPWPA